MNLKLRNEAKECLSKNHHITKHTIASSVLFQCGRIFNSINIRGCDYGVCAERSACAAGFSLGYRNITAIISIYSAFGEDYEIVSPCGNCRQFLVDYASNAIVIMPNKELCKVMDLMKNPYISNFEPIEDRIKNK